MNVLEQRTLMQRVQFAEKDAQAAIERSDYRFIAVHGFADYMPGVKENGETEARIVKKYGLRMIEGTSDTPCNRDVYLGVLKYAEIYNMYLSVKLDIGKIRTGTSDPAPR